MDVTRAYNCVVYSIFHTLRISRYDRLCVCIARRAKRGADRADADIAVPRRYNIERCVIERRGTNGNAHDALMHSNNY